MASIIAAGTTTTTALSYSADTSGVLQLQTNGTTPALTLDTSQNATFAGKVASASSLQLATNGTTTAVTIDTSQNVGVGVTPSAWGSGNNLELANGKYLAWAGAGYFLQNNYYNGTNNIYKINGYALAYYMSGGQHQWFNAPLGTAGNAITFTQAMTLDNSGNVQLGLTTNPQSSRLTVQGAASNIADFESTITTTNGGGIRVSNSGTTELWIGYYQFASAMGAGVTDAGLSARNNLLLDGTNAILFGQNGTEKGRFDTNGNLLVGTTSSSINNVGVQLNSSSDNSTQYCKAFYNAVYGDTYALPQFVGNQGGTYYWGLGNDSGTANANTLRLGTVSGNSTGWYFAGGYFNLKGGAYTNASDYRLKRDVKTFSDSVLERIKIARPISYKQIVQDEKGDLVDCRTEIGFLAHELQELFPEFVLGKKDAVDAAGNIDAQGVDYAKFTAVLTKAIQELSAQVTTLQTQVTALKG